MAVSVERIVGGASPVSRRCTIKVQMSETGAGKQTLGVSRDPEKSRRCMADLA